MRMEMRPYFSLFSSSLSSCKLSGLRTNTDGGVDGLLNGVEVKQVFGLEWGRSTLTGVGFILLEGLDALKRNRNHHVIFNSKDGVSTDFIFKGGNCVDLRRWNRWRPNGREVLQIA